MSLTSSDQGTQRVNQTVGISDMKTSNSRHDVLVTYSLGSCIGLSLYDPVALVGGLIHCMLPLSRTDPAKANRTPAMFVDTGVPLLLRTVFELGATRENLVAKVAGGALLLDEKKLFKIGQRNYTVLRKVLWKNNILIAAEDVGGTFARTMYLDMGTGTTTVKSGRRYMEL